MRNLFALIASSAGLAAATNYDLYVFSQYWVPENCNGYTTTYPGCGSPNKYWTSHLTTHGLWPNYSNGSYPSSCTTEPFDTTVPTQIGFEKMVEEWPNVQAKETDSNYDDFWTHEWSKHGTCTPLNQLTFFNSALNVYNSLGTPSLVSNNVGKSVSLTDLQSAFGGANMAVLLCASGEYLNEVRTCWSFDSSSIPNKQIPCPSAILTEGTCTSATITIASF